MKNMTIEQWMTMEWMPRVDGASQYEIGQSLTKEDAKNIMHMIAQSHNFDIKQPSARKHLHVIGSPYRDFIVSYTLLMMAGAHCYSNWKNSLWNALVPADQAACNKIICNYSARR